MASKFASAPPLATRDERAVVKADPFVIGERPRARHDYKKAARH
jgi:hypothetical protein